MRVPSITKTTPSSVRENFLKSGGKEYFASQLVLYWEPYFPYDHSRGRLADQAVHAYTVDYNDKRYRFETLEEADKFMQVLIAQIALGLN